MFDVHSTSLERIFTKYTYLQRFLMISRDIVLGLLMDFRNVVRGQFTKYTYLQRFLMILEIRIIKLPNGQTSHISIIHIFTTFFDGFPRRRRGHMSKIAILAYT